MFKRRHRVAQDAGLGAPAALVSMVVCALSSGAMFFFSTNLGQVWPAAWFAAVPTLWLAYGPYRPWQIFVVGWAAFFIGQLTLLQAYSIMANTLIPLSAITAIAFGFGMMFARHALRMFPAVVALFAFPAYWTAFEFLYRHLSPNGSYGSLGYSQTPAPIMIQAASLVGLGGVTFLLCLASNAIAIMLRKGRYGLIAGMVAATLVLANVAFGCARLSSSSETHVRVAAAADDDLRFGWTERQTMAIVEGYASLARKLAAAGAKLIVFSEKGALLQPDWLKVTSILGATARSSHATIVAGFEEHGTHIENIALSFKPNGDVLRYAKQRLLDGFEPFTAGTVPGILGDGVAVEICKDLDYPDAVRRDVKGRSVRLMLVPALDFTRDAQSHANIAIMRGVEGGYSIARAARFGMLTVSDSRGRIIASARSNSPGSRWALADVPLGEGETPFLRIGNAFEWACAALVAFIALAFLSRLIMPRRHIV